jgi:preprotein translocase subunit SecD
MKVCARQFNIYFALVAMLALLGGCQTGHHHDKADKKADKQIGVLRVHIETNTGSPDTSQTISVLRSDPMAVTIANDPILTEANIIAAKVIDVPGGFAIEVRFDESGTWILEQYSADNIGKHFAIFGQWSEKITDGRWLAAPIITRRVGNGILAFTPDMSRGEADRMVLGLNNVAKKNVASSSK